MFILVLTESTVQFVACGCRAIKVLQERRWPVEAVLHFAFQILGPAIHVDVELKRATEQLMVQDSFEEHNRKRLRVSPKFLRSQTKQNKNNPRLPDIHQGDKHSGAAKLLSSGLRCFPPLSSL